MAFRNEPDPTSWLIVYLLSVTQELKVTSPGPLHSFVPSFLFTVAGGVSEDICAVSGCTRC